MAELKRRFGLPRRLTRYIVFLHPSKTKMRPDDDPGVDEEIVEVYGYHEKPGNREWQEVLDRLDVGGRSNGGRFIKVVELDLTHEDHIILSLLLDGSAVTEGEGAKRYCGPLREVLFQLIE